MILSFRSTLARAMVVAVAGIILAAGHADARAGRGGGGFGSRGARTFQAPPPTNTAPTPAHPSSARPTPQPGPTAARTPRAPVSRRRPGITNTISLLLKDIITARWSSIPIMQRVTSGSQNISRGSSALTRRLPKFNVRSSSIRCRQLLIAFTPISSSTRGALTRRSSSIKRQLSSIRTFRLHTSFLVVLMKERECTTRQRSPTRKPERSTRCRSKR